MNFGLVGWGIASGNGGMNSDIISLASWITHWLVPTHPSSPNHSEYLAKAVGKTVYTCNLKGDEEIYEKFLDEVDGLIYVEHPCLRDDYDIVLQAKKKGKIVVGIPMWEWWPERKPWALQTDILWAVTSTTRKYLNSLSTVLFMHGYRHEWRGRVYGDKWGVNLSDFPFRKRNAASKFVFVNGNGGYKLRKASDIVFDAFSRPGAPSLIVYTQKNNIASITSKNITVVDKVFPDRSDVYADGDVFLFPSYWEGLCHGIYEAQACGGIVITSEQPPMNECGSPYLLPIKHYEQEDLSGKKICKAIPCADSLYLLANSLYGQDISEKSCEGRLNIDSKFNLENTLDSMYGFIIDDFNRKC